MPLAFFSLSGSWAQLLSQIWFIRLKRTQREIWFKTWFLYLVSLPSKWKDATYSHKKKKKKNQNFTKWLTPNQIISAVRIERKKRFGGDLWRRRSRMWSEYWKRGQIMISFERRKENTERKMIGSSNSKEVGISVIFF